MIVQTVFFKLLLWQTNTKLFFRGARKVNSAEIGVLKNIQLSENKWLILSRIIYSVDSLVFDNNTWNQLTVCKQMNSDSFTFM